MPRVQWSNGADDTNRGVLPLLVQVVYFLYRAVRAHVYGNQWGLAHDSLLLAAAHCGLDVRQLEASPVLAAHLQPRHRDHLGWRSGRWLCRGGMTRGLEDAGHPKWGWFSLQASIMADLMHFSQMLGNDERAARYGSYWLSRVGSLPVFSLLRLRRSLLYRRVNECSRQYGNMRPLIRACWPVPRSVKRSVLLRCKLTK